MLKLKCTARTGKPGHYRMVPPGTDIPTLSEEETQTWVTRGFAQTAGSADDPSDTEENIAQAGDPPEDPAERQALIEAIVDAIADLPEDAFNKRNGKPSVRAIEAILGQDINGAHRDEAWALYQAIAAGDPGGAFPST